MSAPNRAVQAQAADWYARMHAEDAAPDQAAFDAWLAADPAHGAEYEKLERGLALSGGLAATDVYRHTHDLEQFARPKWATAPRMALAASLVFAILLTVVFVSQRGAAPDKLVMLAETSRLGEIRAVKLPDGTAVTLDTDSRIETRFDKTSRRVRLLQGRARFDVKPDPARLFIVEAAGRDISVDGTRFDVQRVNNRVRVQSLDGLVSVRPSRATPQYASFTVPAGQQVIFSDRDDTGRPVKATAGSERWVEGMLFYQGAPLSTVLAETNRYSARHIVLADPALGDLKVTGAFRPLPVEELAKELAAAFGLKVTKTSSGDLLLSRA